MIEKLMQGYFEKCFWDCQTFLKLFLLKNNKLINYLEKQFQTPLTLIFIFIWKYIYISKHNFWTLCYISL